MVKKFVSASILSFASLVAMAQAEIESSEVEQSYREELEQQYNPNSINPIPLYEQHYKVRVWRNIDLQEKQNKGFFSRNGEISKLVIDAISSGELVDIYASDSLTTKLSKEDFFDRLQQEEATAYDPWNPTRDWYTDDITSYNGRNYRALQDSRGLNPETSPEYWAVTSEGKASFFFPSDISKLQMVEDIIFDRRRSRLYYDIQAIELSVPGEKTQDSFDKSLGWIKYKDLEKVFRAHPEKAVWFNRQNTAQNKNFADAILLRLFHGVIHKIQNPDDLSIREIYTINGRPYYESVWAREWAEIELMEKEHNLWEF